MSRFRLRVRHGTDAFTFTDWEEEDHQRSAPARVLEVRRQYPNGAISIEREGDNRKPNLAAMVRFQIKVKDATYYSRLIAVKDKDSALASIREQFPQAEIIEEAIHG